MSLPASVAASVNWEDEPHTPQARGMNVPRALTGSRPRRRLRQCRLYYMN
jgi:hypothetical protein